MTGRLDKASDAGARYALHDEIASGGMGTVHLGRMHGAAGFSRIVAIKRLNAHLAKQSEFLEMFLDEARMAGRVRHPNVVPILDVVETGGEVLLVMEYVHGESLSRLIRLSAGTDQRLAVPILSAIMSGVLYGLHAAHEATDERGEPLGLVHRDVSPQNVLVGVDGVARVLDFGVAKARGRLQTTREGQVKGKLAYMTPEQIQGERVDRRADVFSAGIVLWEALTGERLFAGDNEGNTLRKILLGHVEPPSSRVPSVPAAIEAVVMRALARLPADRFSTAREMGVALVEACAPAPPHVVGEWVEGHAHDALAKRASRVAELESGARVGPPDVAPTAEPNPTSTTAVEVAGSQVSSISVSVAQAPSRGRLRGRAALGAAAVVTVVAGVLMAQRWSEGDEGVRPASGSPDTSEGAASVAEAPLPAPSPPEPVVPPQAPASSSSAASSAAAPPPPPPTVRPPSTPPRPPATARPASCEPPFVRAPDGRKIWKRECLGNAP